VLPEKRVLERRVGVSHRNRDQIGFASSQGPRDLPGPRGRQHRNPCVCSSMDPRSLADTHIFTACMFWWEIPSKGRQATKKNQSIGLDLDSAHVGQDLGVTKKWLLTGLVS
jgi:hypothetical protein